ncbi:MAG: peptidylprolyl isomerase [Eubacteriaceae bacterium]|jgi:peptidyl-prolyl cis-trans isomerase B (cyclophilin B)|nr:peptidylprolyl isomerase [Eubacteriaceae bacterium]
MIKRKTLRPFFQLLVFSLALASCTKENLPPESASPDQSVPNEYAEITMQDESKIVIELFMGTVPITAQNFKKLVTEGFYDGLTFHRAVKGLIIQGGDPKGDGTGHADSSIQGEFASNGFDNPNKHVRGSVSMARSSDPNSASCQFFICLDSYPVWDGDYAVFGKVVSGIEAAESMSNLDVIDDIFGEIANKPIIKTIRIIENPTALLSK